MSELLFNLRTRKQIDSYLTNPSHALGIVGPLGAGKGAVAEYVAAQILGIDQQAIHAYPYFRKFIPQNGVITIDTARELTSYMKLKTTGSASLRRVVVIEDAHTMTMEAQNAILKVIEEPPGDTVVMLTLVNGNAVLPTIASRLQLISLYTIDTQTVSDYFVSLGHDKADVAKYFLISGGLPGLLHALLESDNDHPLVGAIDKAKSLLKADTFERLTMIDDVVKEKQTSELLLALGYISQAALEQAAVSNSNENNMKRWGKILAAVHEAQEMTRSNAQAKLVLTNLFLAL